MKVLVNLLRFDPKINIGGNYSYSYNISKQLINNDNNDYIFLVTNSNKKMFEFNKGNVKFLEYDLSTNMYIRILQENMIISNNAKAYFADVYFSPSTLLPFKSIEIPAVCTIHDLNFKHFSQGLVKDIYKNYIYKRTLKNANQIIAVSEFTKNDIIKQYNIHEDKIKVIYNASNFNIKDIDLVRANEIKNRYELKSKYIMAISHYKHKNAHFAIELFSLVKNSLNEKYDLLIIGAKGELLNDLKEYCNIVGLNHNEVRFIEYVETPDMPYMYYNASLFLFPSQFEGFGIPLLESMQVGCPTIASNCASIPEILGDNLLSIDLSNKEKWAESIINILNDSKYRELIVRNGYERCLDYSWEKSATELNKIFESLLKNNILI